jgi:hypothetical protein
LVKKNSISSEKFSIKIQAVTPLFIPLNIAFVCPDSLIGGLKKIFSLIAL